MSKAERTRLLLIGPVPPPYCGWSHVVASMLRPPLNESLDLRCYNTTLREDPARKHLGPSQLFRLAHQVSGLGLALRRQQPAMAVLFTGPYGGFWRDLWLLKVCNRLRVPVVIRAFGGKLTERIAALPAPLRELVVRCYSRSRGILVELQSMVQQFNELAPGVPVWRCPNFIHPEDLPRTGPQCLPSGDTGVLYMGNITPTKGVETVLDSVDRVCGGHAATFHFIGGENMQPGYLEYFRSRAGELRFADKVHIHGYLHRSQALEIAEQCQIFAFPSQWPGEGVPAVLVESMAMGLVPVATCWRGIPQVVKHGESGILIDQPEPGLLAESICRLLGDRELYQRLSRGASAAIEEGYTARAALRQWQEIIFPALLS